MSELGRPFLHPDLRRLIEADRNEPAPPDSVKRQIGERLDRSLGLGGAIIAAAPGFGLTPPPLRDSGAPSVPPPPPASLFGWKAIAGGTLAAVFGGVVALSFANRGPAPVPPSHSFERVGYAVPSAPVETSGAQPREVVLDDPTDVRVTDSAAKPRATRAAEGNASARTPRHRRAARASTAPVVVDTLAAERMVLDGARSSLVHHDAAGALAALRSHEQAFPRGQLLEERESMRVQALSLAHDYAAARAVGDKFRRHFPRSMFLPAVEQALDAAP
jgi:hypothetical protein